MVKSCSRFVLMVWLLLALLLMQSYTANLTSILTLDQLQPSFLNVNDLRRGGYYVGYQFGSFVYDVLIEQFKFDPSKLRPYRNIGEYHDALKLGSKNGGVAAIFDEVPYLKLYLQEYGSNYIMAGPEYRNAGFGFVSLSSLFLILLQACASVLLLLIFVVAVKLRLNYTRFYSIYILLVLFMSYSKHKYPSNN